MSMEVFRTFKPYVVAAPISKIVYYRKGQCIKLSERGLKSFKGLNNFFDGEWKNRLGEVLRRNQGATIYVRWEGNSAESRIHYSYLEIAR